MIQAWDFCRLKQCASVALKLCDEQKSVGPGDLKDIGVEMKGLSVVYDSKRPKLTGSDIIDAETKELADAVGTSSCSFAVG
jgi:hypothetical protein